MNGYPIIGHGADASVYDAVLTDKSVLEVWIISPGFDLERLGLLPELVESPANGQTLAQHIDQSYAHGGGWRSFGADWSLDLRDGVPASLTFPGDPAMPEVARFATKQRELFILFTNEFCAIVQPDGSFSVARMD